MSTNASNGVSFILQVSADGGSTWQTIAGAKKATLTRKTTAIDTTTKDDNGDKSNQPGAREWLIAFDQLWVLSDAGQLDIQAAQAAGTQLKAKIQYNGSGNTATGTCTVTDLAEDLPDNEAVTFTGTLQGSGPLAYAGTAH